MNKISKLGIALLTVAMCVLLSVTVWAITYLDVDITATTDKDEFCVSGSEQFATITIKAEEEIDIISLDGNVVLPNGWSIISIKNDEIGLTVDNYNEDGKIVWFAGGISNKNTTNLIELTVKIPADVNVGEYEIGLSDLELAKLIVEDNNYDIGYYAEALTVTTKITVKEHDYKTTYSFASDGKACTAERVCKNDATHVETATAEITSEVTTPATCEGKGWTTYTATFDEDWALTQRKTIEDIAPINHDWGAADYDFAADGKVCTAERVCKNDASHIETATAEITSEVTTPATCEGKGWTTYTATFNVDWTTTQTKVVEDIAALGHKDENHDHICDNSCGVYQGTHADSSEDNDHVCDYGCGDVLEDCIDTDHDHACDNGCDVYHGIHADSSEDKDHVCDYGCGDVLEDCIDTDHDHACDNGCDVYHGIHADSSEDKDHVCDYGCGDVLEDCDDADNDKDHNCDVCGEENVTEHVFTYGEYVWNDDNTECTITRTCNCTLTETANAVITSEVTTPATCEGKGWTTYTATFTEGWATTQTKEVEDVAPINHAWGEASYKDNEDGTHTAIYTCANDANHTKSDAPAEHVYKDGECICGAKEPIDNVDVVFIGAVLENSYVVEGKNIVVTFELPCKVGYWSESDGKYIALTATQVSENIYSFTAPEEVNEVLLVVKGDVNGNGGINNTDKVRLNAYLLEKTNLSNEAKFAADVIGIGTLNNTDKVRLNAYLLEKAKITW